MEFEEFPKIPRLSREIIVTEKIDGTNGQIAITEDGQMFVGSRSRWITPDNDNHGFAKWVNAHRDELMTLGVGRHFGEWWGQGIQRGYLQNRKRFSLFNVLRWADVRPACCDVVPILYRGTFNQDEITACLVSLEMKGSVVAPGFMNAEGVIVFHVDAGMGFKKTIKKDDVPKSQISSKH